MLATFASLDKNNDGSVTREELFQKMAENRPAPKADKPKGDAPRREGDSRAGRPRPGEGHGPRPESLFERFDKDKTGSLTKDNVPERVWDRISKADSNSDGKVSKEELQAHMKAHRPNRDGDKPAEPKKENKPEEKPAEEKPADTKPSADIRNLDGDQTVSALVTEN